VAGIYLINNCSPLYPHTIDITVPPFGIFSKIFFFVEASMPQTASVFSEQVGY